MFCAHNTRATDACDANQIPIFHSTFNSFCLHTNSALVTVFILLLCTQYFQLIPTTAINETTRVAHDALIYNLKKKRRKRSGKKWKIVLHWSKLEYQQRVARILFFFSLFETLTLFRSTLSLPFAYRSMQNCWHMRIHVHCRSLCIVLSLSLRLMLVSLVVRLFRLLAAPFPPLNWM